MGYPGKNQSQLKETPKTSLLLSELWQGLPGSRCQESSQHFVLCSRGIDVLVGDEKGVEHEPRVIFTF